MATRGYKGFECVFSIGGVPVGIAVDVDPDYTAGLFDVTARDGDGWKQFLQGLREWQITIRKIWLPTNAGLQALRAAYLAGTEVATEWTDKDGHGFSGQVIVTDFHPGQTISDAVFLSCTLKGTGAPSVVGGTS